MRRLLLGLVLSLSCGSLFAAGIGPAVFINEIHYDNASTDVGEFVEVAGPAGTNLAGWSIVLYNGSSTQRNVYGTIDLSGVIPDQQNGFGAIAFERAGIQNGNPDAVALVHAGTTVVQFLSYGGTFVAANGPAVGTTSIDIGVVEDGLTAVGHSLQLRGTGTNYGDFAWAGPDAASAGSLNTGQVFSTSTALALFIDDVTVQEGDAGTTTATFTVGLTAAAPAGGVTFDIATANDTATAGSDYVPVALTAQSIPAGSTTYSVAVTVNADTTYESDESFFVNVTNVAGAVAADDQGLGTITNDDLNPNTPAVLISEFRFRGPSGANDEFIELYNNSDEPADISGWKIQASNTSGTVGTRLTIAGGTIIPPRGHFLAANRSSGGYSGTVAADQTYTTGVVDAGGIALTLPNDLIIDQVGLSTGSAFVEGTPLGSLGSTNADRSYERLPGGPDGSTQDTNDNTADFVLVSPSAPQSLSSPSTPGPIPPTGLASATPDTVERGDAVLFTVAVTRGAKPDSTIITVTGDLTPIGGAASQPLYDNATNGDAVAGDLVYSYRTTVATGTAEANHSLTFAVADIEGRMSSASTTLAVVPPSPVHEIFAIQGSGPESPFKGQRVRTVDNVVTGVGPQGFFIQTPDSRADSSTATSNGIYVFTGSPAAVQVGNEVEVVGTVVEFFGMTEFSGGIAYTVTSTSTALPQYFAIAPGFTDFETVESMLVRVTDGTAATGSDQFGETAVVAASERPFRQPGLDDGAVPGLFGIDPTWGTRTPSPGIVGGATIDVAAGPLMFTFSDYVIWTTELEFTNPPFPRPVRARAAGEMTVAAQNMFRLFDSVNDPGTDDPVIPADVYQARLGDFSAHVRNVLGSPDVLAVSEAENLTVLTDLAARIHADDAALTYTAHLLEGNDIGGIDVGFLVRDTVRVDSVEQLGASDTWLEPGATEPKILNDRPPLLLRGTYIANGTPFPISVIAVHQRSLIGVETSDRVRAKREEQAERLAQYVQQLQNSDPAARIVVTGDFNAFEFNDGYVDVMGIVTSSTEPDLTNEVLSVPALDRYSYLHNAKAQVLDHSLTTAGLRSYVRGLQFARANADAPVSAGRVSDHDGLVLFVMTDQDGDTVPDDVDTCQAGDNRATVVLGTCDSRATNVRFEDGCTIADRLKSIAATARHRGELVSTASAMLNDAMKSGMITGAEKGSIESCVARWNP